MREQKISELALMSQSYGFHVCWHARSCLDYFLWGSPGKRVVP